MLAHSNASAPERHSANATAPTLPRAGGAQTALSPSNTHGLADEVRAAIGSNPQRAFEEVLGASLIRKPGSKEPVARCPFHDDRRPSLRVNLQKATYFCDPCGKGGDLFDLAQRIWSLDFPACVSRLADLLGVTYSNGNPARAHALRTSTASGQVVRQVARRVMRRLKYEVRDLDGTLKATHHRIEYDDGSKDMPWEPAGINPAELPLFQIEKTTDSMDGETVVLCEGEKAAAALWERRGLAVATVTGADLEGRKVHCDESLKALIRLDVVCWRDNDPAGEAHMRAHADALTRLGCKSVRWLDWKEAPEKGDAANFNGSDEELQALIDAAQSFPHNLPALRDDGNALTIVENSDRATLANREYLECKPVVDRLLYAKSISLICGRKARRQNL
jgi:DNA primase